jgi:branched-chain amino acid transport system ATP-binding protein
MSDQRVVDAYLGAHHDTDISELEEVVVAEHGHATGDEPTAPPKEGPA